MWIRVLGFVALWPLLAGADEPTLSIEQAIDEALRQAPQVVASAAALDGAQAEATSAGRLPDPELVTGFDNLPIEGAERFSFTDDFMTMRKIGVMQSFPSSKKRHLQSELAAREVALAQAQLGKTRFDTARATADTWIALAQAEESLRRLRSLKPEVDLQAVAGRAALASGRDTAGEALAAQTMVAALEERILALQLDVELGRAQLARWIGSAADRPLAPFPADSELRASLDALLQDVPQHAPLAPMNMQIAAAQTDVELARAEKRPGWSAELTYANRGSDFSDMVSLEFRIGLPFFAKNRQDPVIAGKLATVRAQQAERDAEVRMHSAEVRAAYAEWRGGRERLRHYEAELVPLARDRSRAALSSYSSGRGNLRSAIDALAEEAETQLEFVQLQGSVARSWVFLHLLHETGAPQ